MNKPAPVDFNALLNRLQNRRAFLQLIGKGLGYTALASTLPACGGGGGGGGGDGDGAGQTEAVIPLASAEYTALKRTSFGVHRDALRHMQDIGIDAYLEEQLDYTQINDGNLEATIQALFPLSAQSPAQLTQSTASPTTSPTSPGR